MQSKKLMILAIVLGVGAVIAVNWYVQGVENAYKSDQIVVYRAKTALPIGKTVSMKNLERVTLSRRVFGSAAKIAVTETDIALIQTALLTKPVDPGDVLFFSHFDRSVDRGLRDRIPAGLKAVSIPVDESGSVGYFVQPGDHVDVLGTLLIENRLVTQPILEDVQVLAVGGQFEPSSAAFYAREGYSTVTLAVTLEQAEKLVFSQNMLKDKVTLLLRRPDDRGKRTQPVSVNAADPKQFSSVN